jgi:hypothetical protein
MGEGGLFQSRADPLSVPRLWFGWRLLLAAEPRVLGDGLDPVFGFFETPPCGVYPNRFHGLRRSTAPLFSVSAREVPRDEVSPRLIPGRS